MGLANAAYESSEEDTLADCQQLCVLDDPLCQAVDYRRRKCSLIYKYDYRTDDLAANDGNVHSVLMPC